MVAKPTWSNPSDSPVIEQSIHDYISSIYRQLSGKIGDVEIIPISPGAEAKRGWDACVKEVIPLYFQYKLPDFTSRPESSQNKVFVKRKEWHFDDSKGLFHFYLRAKAAQEPRSQHELMVELMEKNVRAYYVSTTFIDLNRLRRRGAPFLRRPWVFSSVTMLHNELMEIIDQVPLFKDVICIPPYTNVDPPVHTHQFFFNHNYEVSLHSTPEAVDNSISLHELIKDQLDLFESNIALNVNNIDEHVQLVLLSISNDTLDGERYSLVRSYYDAKLEQVGENGAGVLMSKLRVLSKVVKQLSGLDVLLTVKISRE